MAGKYRVGILGATGMVGQRFVQLLEDHPQFEVTGLAASDRSQGKSYSEACAWRLPSEMPASVRALRVEAPRPPLDCDLVFSSLPGEMAREVEGEFARAGYLQLIERQRAKHDGRGGFIVTNPNCSTIMLALALAPLNIRFRLESVVVTTMQALSGAGYPGVASLDVSDNVLPFIENEEEKVETETQKILGRIQDGEIAHAPFSVSAQCNRVNVSDGHMAAVRVKLTETATLEEVRDCLINFSSLPQELRLHSAPARPLIVRDEPDRPQPRLDRDAGKGMSVTIGRLARDRVMDYRFVTLSHNTIRGAAGAAILNAELLLATNRI
ncbi:MAG: hypothetical protein AUG51_17785 [Acidobacteria bacterium 13_1_20CM_3_53_8]|nr:MAG: hypothetical protein AUG51_17785 [Acidobacteria bacterium 13_1_20CM_3_53_8]